jgi:hypothetical protein
MFWTNIAEKNETYTLFSMHAFHTPYGFLDKYKINT